MLNQGHITLWVVTLGLSMAYAPLRAAQPSGAKSNGEYDLSTPKGPHHRIVEREVDALDAAGNPVKRTSRYTELANGIHYFEGGEWKTSEEKVEPHPKGARAGKGRYQVLFGKNLNRSGAIEITLPSGETQKNHPLGLYYFDRDSGDWVKLSGVKDSEGRIIPPNKVLYRDAFSEVKADLLYTYQKGKFEADVILRENPPAPSSFGLSNATTVLEMVTEFVGGPAPEKREIRIKEETNAAKRGTMAQPDVTDELLAFGEMTMIQGTAFPIEASHARPSDPSKHIPVGKRWRKQGSRDILSEQIEYKSLEPMLAALPQGVTKGQGKQGGAKQAATTPQTETSTAVLVMTEGTLPTEGGVVLDYTSHSGSESTFTFVGGSTYLISGQFSINTCSFSSGAYLKFAPSAYLYITGTASGSGAYFTSRNDLSLGEPQTSDGGTVDNYTAAIHLYYPTSSPLTLDSLHVRYATTAIHIENASGSLKEIICNNAQIFSCGTAFKATGYSTAKITANSPCFYNVTTQSSGTGTVSVNSPGTCGNTAPGLSDITNVSINEDNNTGAIPFGVHDVQTSAGSLNLTKSSSNQSLVPDANIVFGGSGASRTVTVTPAANASGTATITVTVSDGSLTASDSFVLTVNDTPTISNITDQTMAEDGAPLVLSFTVGDSETAAGSLTLTANSSNAGLIPNANVAFGGSGANRTASITAAANQSGTATITITVSDGSATASDSFVVTVLEFNDNPTISSVGSQIVNENASANLNFTVADPDHATSDLTMTATSSDTSVVSAAGLSWSGTGGSRTLSISTAPGSSGNTTITARVTDPSGDFSQTQFLVTANAAPKITTNGDRFGFVNESTGRIEVRISDPNNTPGTLTRSVSFSNSAMVQSHVLTTTSWGAELYVTPAAIAGNLVATITAQDSLGANSSAQFSLIIQPDFNNWTGYSDGRLAPGSNSLGTGASGTDAPPPGTGGGGGFEPGNGSGPSGGGGGGLPGGIPEPKLPQSLSVSGPDTCNDGEGGVESGTIEKRTSIECPECVGYSYIVEATLDGKVRRTVGDGVALRSSSGSFSFLPDQNPWPENYELFGNRPSNESDMMGTLQSQKVRGILDYTCSADEESRRPMWLEIGLISPNGHHGASDQEWCQRGASATASGIRIIGILDREAGECVFGQCDLGSFKTANNCVNVVMNAGRAAYGRGKVNLSLFEDRCSPLLTTPSLLMVSGEGQGVEVIRQSGIVRQIKSMAGLTDVVTNTAYNYRVSFYPLSAIGNNGAKQNGLFVLNGGASPVRAMDISNPSNSPTEFRRLRICDLPAGSWTGAMTNDFVWTHGNASTPGSWELVKCPLTSCIRKDYSTNGLVRTELFSTMTTAGQTSISTDREKWETKPFGTALIERCTDPTGPCPITINHTYGTTANAPEFGKMTQTTFSNGKWQTIQYDVQGRVSIIRNALGAQPLTSDDNLCRKITYDYTPLSGSGDTGVYAPHLPRTEVHYVKSREVTRKYFVYLLGEERAIVAVNTGAAWNDTSNLVTITKRFTTGPFTGELQSLKNPDGTMTICSFATNTTFVLKTISRGQPNAGGTSIIAGTRKEITHGLAGELLTNAVYDVASNLLVDRTVYSNFDSSLRAQVTTFLDGKTELRAYGCCGLDSITEKDGTVTTFQYDHLKRLTNTVRLGISEAKVYDADNRVTARLRRGSDNSLMSLEGFTFDEAGRLTFSTNAAGIVTKHDYALDSGTGIGTVTTTLAFGTSASATRVESSFRDGSPLKVTGTAVSNPVRYELDVAFDGTYWRLFHRSIKLNTDGTDTLETVANYQDPAGRTYKSVFASASGAPTAYSYFNAQGQLIMTVDPDNIWRLFQYDGEGQVSHTAIDIDKNGVIDFAGTDRIVQTVRDVLAHPTYLVNVLRTRTYEWKTDNVNSSILVGTSEQSTDGLQTWDTKFGLVSSSLTAYPSSGVRTVTVTAADGSKTIHSYLNGRFTSSTRQNASAGQLGQTTISYDAHGRKSSETDARNGTTTFSYDSADRVTTVTTPVPGNGGAAQVTTSSYDAHSRVWKTVLPDGSSVTNEYFSTGQLKKTSGSRTYPVEYTYDAQGRMKTMKTWQGFASNTGAATTTWNYDAYRGFLSSKIYNDGNGTEYTYTQAGRLLTRKWARGSPRLTTTYSYNAAGDLVGVAYSDGSAGMTHTYDRRGRKATSTCATVTTTYSYADSGFLNSESYSGTLLNGLSVQYTPDAYLRRQQVQAKNGTTALTTHIYAYDNGGRLSSATDETFSATYTYLANSPLVREIAFKENSSVRMTTTKSHDKLNRLMSIQSAPSSSPAIGSTYLYNNANQRTRNQLADGSYWIYEYDSLGQVVSGKRYWTDHTPVAGQQFEYAHDDIGNRTSTKSGGDANGGGLRTANYTRNLLNQYTQREVPGALDILGLANSAATVTVNTLSAYRKSSYFHKELTVANSANAVWQSLTISAVNGASSTTVTGNSFVPKTPEVYTYDLDGNTTKDGRWDYTWDAENRLTTLVGHTSLGTPLRVAFEYDCMGRRVRKRTWGNTAGTGTPILERKFLYDGWNLIAELDASNAVVNTYLWGLDLSGTMQGAGGVGGLIGMRSAGGTMKFAAYDGNGNVMGLVDGTTGQTEAHYEYGPFGENVRSTGTSSLATTNPFRFSTKYQDNETDLLYYGYRYYNPSTGRWPNRDPIGESDSHNMYVMVHNLPVGMIDSLGLRKVTIELIYDSRIPVNRQVKDEVNRILQKCIKSCVKCDKSNKPHHSVKLVWTPTNKPYKDFDLGADKLLNPTKYAFHFGYNAAGPMGRAGGTTTAAINPLKIEQEATGNGLDADKSLAAVLAHEAFYHGIGGTANHEQPPGFIDSWPAAVGGNLSEKNCKELCDELDIDD